MRLCLIKMRRKPPMITIRLPNQDLNNDKTDRNAKWEGKISWDLTSGLRITGK